MKHTLALAVAAASLLATPVFAAPPAKRSPCQLTKAPARDAKRVEPCRRQAIPPILDQTPLFLASAVGSATMSAE